MGYRLQAAPDRAVPSSKAGSLSKCHPFTSSLRFYDSRLTSPDLNSCKQRESSLSSMHCIQRLKENGEEILSSWGRNKRQACEGENEDLDCTFAWSDKRELPQVPKLCMDQIDHIVSGLVIQCCMPKAS